MNLLKAEQAVLNNTVWCDAVCASHGIPCEWREAAWVNWHQTPPFYPNMVTLGGASESRIHQEYIRELVQVGLPSEWGVKDSFRTLELEPLGFRELFVAGWLYLPTATTVRESTSPEVSWEVITTAAALEEWEKAWSGESGVRNLFVPQLLQCGDVAFLAARRQSQIVAGCIAKRAAECVGLSNLFLPVEEAQELQRGCIANARSTFPGFLLVGYESGADLDAMKELGFETVGELRVWLYEG
ncbi:hypothetical protein IAD21_05710 [Abditibacteriota bacterium]|nr:hypothetical protein IAD21_05710 [Abditibacteriota bacterium]